MNTPAIHSVQGARPVPTDGLAVPDQAVLDGLMADAQGVADAIAEYVGARQGTVNIAMHFMPAALYHALPHPVTEGIGPRENGTMPSWKQLAKTGWTGHISAYCADGEACPDQRAPEHSPFSHGDDYGSFLTCAECAPDRVPDVDELHERAMADQ